MDRIPDPLAELAPVELKVLGKVLYTSLCERYGPLLAPRLIGSTFFILSAPAASLGPAPSAPLTPAHVFARVGIDCARVRVHDPKPMNIAGVIKNAIGPEYLIARASLRKRQHAAVHSSRGALSETARSRIPGISRKEGVLFTAGCKVFWRRSDDDVNTPVFV